MDLPEMEGTIKRVLADRFPDAAIDRVIVKPDVDSDGDAVLRVTVVLASEVARLNSDRLVGIVRHLRSELQGSEFPMLSFVTRKEAAQLKLEAA